MTAESKITESKATLRGRYGFTRSLDWDHTEVYDAALEKAEDELSEFEVSNFSMELVADEDCAGYKWELELQMR